MLSLWAAPHASLDHYLFPWVLGVATGIVVPNTCSALPLSLELLPRAYLNQSISPHV